MSYLCTVKEGDLMTEEGATFIVNASNTRLLLGSGVSSSFREHCGRELQDEMLEKLQKRGGALRQGDVIMTSPGRAANFDHALHAAIMNYGPASGSAAPTLGVIERSLEQIEEHLRQHSMKSGQTMKLVLPLMGCGVGALDKREVAGLYRRFFEREVGFDCEVVVYGHSRGDYDLIREILLS